MEVGIERLAAFAFIVTGLSHIAAPRIWVRFFTNMRAWGEAGAFLNGYVHMPLGLLILSFHQVWSGPGLLVTLIGAGLTVKGLICFVWPRLALKSLAKVSEERAWQFQAAGFLSLVLGLVIGWIALVHGGQLQAA
jgi:uncharacterized protein YjeT (DUF2065 family)